MSAVPGARARLRLGQGRQPDFPDRSEPAPQAQVRPRVALRPQATAPGRSRRRPSRSCAASRPPSSRWSEAADIFNSSDYRRTVGGIAKSLGEPHASVVPLSGVKSELVVTVAWDISWYQYRVTPELGAARPAGRARPRARGARRAATSGGTHGSSRTAGSSRRSRRLTLWRRPLRSYNQSVIYCVIPPRARGRAVRQDGRVLQGQPERDRDRRPTQGPRPAEPEGRRRRKVRGAARDPRPAPRPDPGTFPETEAPSSRLARVAL